MAFGNLEAKFSLVTGASAAGLGLVCELLSVPGKLSGHVFFLSEFERLMALSNEIKNPSKWAGAWPPEGTWRGADCVRSSLGCTSGGGALFPLQPPGFPPPT